MRGSQDGGIAFFSRLSDIFIFLAYITYKIKKEPQGELVGHIVYRYNGKTQQKWEEIQYEKENEKRGRGI